jgi:hypothetical protein
VPTLRPAHFFDDLREQGVKREPPCVTLGKEKTLLLLLLAAFLALAGGL